MAGKGGGTTTQTGDPEVSALNRITREQVEQTLPLVGGLPGATAFRPGAIPGAGEQDILSRMAGIAGAPVDIPGFLAGNIQRFMPMFDPRAAQAPTVGSPSMQFGQQPGGAGTTFAPFAGAPMPGAAQVPIPGIRDARDISQQFMGDLRGAFEQTVAPGVVNYLTAAGMGRSGAVGENLAQAGAQFVAPTIQAGMQASEADRARQQAAQQMQAGFQQQAGLTGAGFLQEALRALEGRQQQAGLAGAGFAQEAAQAGATRQQGAAVEQFRGQSAAQQLQAQLAGQTELANLAARQQGTGQAFQAAAGLPIPGAVELQRLPTALAALEAPRQAQLAEESRRGDMLVDFLLGRLPMGSGAGSSTVSSNQSLLPNLLQAGGTSALALGMK